MPENTKTRQKDKDTGRDPLEIVLASFENFVASISDGAITSVKDDETKQLLSTNATILQSQFKKLTTFTRDNYSILNSGQKKEIDQFLEIQDGSLIANSGTETAKKAFKKGWFKKFLKWALQWFKEIKKVLKEIIDLILNALGIKFPAWLETLFLLLDEIYDALVSLLADVFGLDVGKFISDASKAEVYYLNELYALEKLKMLRNAQIDFDDE